MIKSWLEFHKFTYENIPPTRITKKKKKIIKKYSSNFTRRKKNLSNPNTSRRASPDPLPNFHSHTKIPMPFARVFVRTLSRALAILSSRKQATRRQQKERESWRFRPSFRIHFIPYSLAASERASDEIKIKGRAKEMSLIRCAQLRFALRARLCVNGEKRVDVRGSMLLMSCDRGLMYRWFLLS